MNIDSFYTSRKKKEFYDHHQLGYSTAMRVFFCRSELSRLWAVPNHVIYSASALDIFWHRERG